MANIGTLAIKLTANPTGLHSALDQAEKRVGKFAGNVSKLLVSPFTGLQKAAGVVTGGIGKFLQPIQSLVTSIPFIGGALAAIPLTGAGFTEFLKSGMDDIVAIGRESRKLGIDVSAMSGLFYAAGTAGEALVHGIGHMERSIHEASTGGKEAVATFQALGLSAEELAGMAPDQAFQRIAESIKGLKNPYDQAAAAQKIFGKAGLELLPVLGKDLDEARKKAEQLGLTFGESGLAEVQKASKALREIDLVVAGLKRQLAIAGAPFIESLAKWFTDLIEKGPGIKGVISSVMDFLLTTMADVSDAITDVIQLLRDAKTTAETVKLLARPGGPQAFALAALSGSSNQVGQGGVGDKIRELRDRALKGLNEVGGGAAAGGPGKPAFDPEAFKRVQELLAGMGGPMDKWKKDTAELQQLFDKGALKFQDWLKLTEKIGDELARAVGVAKTPLEEFNDKLEMVKKLQDAGHLDLAEKLGAQGFLDLEKSLPKTENKLPPALVEGSAAAYSAIAKAEAAGGQVDMLERVKNVLDIANQQATRREKLLADINGALQQLGVAGGP